MRPPCAQPWARTIARTMCLAMLLLTAAPAWSQTTRPLIHTAESATVEQRTLNRAIKRPAGTTTAPTSPASPGLSWMQVLLSLGLVIGLILALRWAGGRFFGLSSTARASRTIQVLSRSMVAPKQQLLLVQVGRRLLVLANNGSQISPLCQITRADEVAELLGQIQREKAESLGTSFSGWFGKAEEKFQDAPRPQSPPGDGESSRGDAEPSSGPVDPELAVTREEIGGLMDKVRSLSRQFRP